TKFFSKKSISGECIALSRNPRTDAKDVTSYQVDLLQGRRVETIINGIALNDVEHVVYVHCVGKFGIDFRLEEIARNGLEPNDYAIDPEVYKSNVVTCLNVMGPLLNRVICQRATLTVCILDSLCDRTRTRAGMADVPFWRSFAYAKRELRNYLKKIVRETAQVRAVSTNVSTINTTSERDLRPNADWRFWLLPPEVVKASRDAILFGTGAWYDVDTYKVRPGFDLNKYYFNLPDMWGRWEREMGPSFEKYALKPRKLLGNH
ncbi:MAG: hypothetical protein ABIG39_07900, partial [Candidatus Micrarchaeota archaeon]